MYWGVLNLLVAHIESNMLAPINLIVGVIFILLWIFELEYKI